jgi:hypothetical protein
MRQHKKVSASRRAEQSPHCAAPSSPQHSQLFTNSGAYSHTGTSIVMIGFILIAACLAAFTSVVDAECANACNGHGRCTSYDMCICNRNWQAADCSERVCMFGLAHVDTPKVSLRAEFNCIFIN